MQVLRVAFHNAIHCPEARNSIRSKEDNVEINLHQGLQMMELKTKKGVQVLVPFSNISSMTFEGVIDEPRPVIDSRPTQSTKKKKTTSKKLVQE